MRLPRRQFLHVALAAAAVLAAPRSVRAQAYPDRPVRMIVPYAPGGPTDVITRLLAQRLTEHLARQFFVENVGGGGGNIGMGRAAKAAPDGYTLLVVNPSYVINPTLYDKVPYEFEKDFDPVTLAVATTLVLTVHPSVRARTVDDLVALIKAIPANTATLRREPGRRDTSSASNFDCRSVSTSCMCPSTVRAWRWAPRSRAIRRSASLRRHPPRSRSSTAGCVGSR